MTNARSPVPLLAIAQTGLALFALAAALFYPTAGHTAVLLAPGTTSPGEAIHWGTRHGASLMGLTADGTAPLLRLPTHTTALAAIADGYIPMLIDTQSCSTSRLTPAPSTES